MKQFTLLTAAIIMILASACGGGAGQEGSGRKKDVQVADTGYTGIKNYVRDNVKLREVTYKNGIREGMTRTFYKGGQLEQEIPYSGDSKNGKWFYPDGKVFRVRPMSMIQFMVTRFSTTRTGVKARLRYTDGRRHPRAGKSS